MMAIICPGDVVNHSELFIFGLIIFIIGGLIGYVFGHIDGEGKLKRKVK